MVSKQTRSAGGIVLNKKGQVLVVSQHGTAWSLPKGHVEKGEDDIEAAIREIEEESGIGQLDFVRDLGSYTRHRINEKGSEDKAEIKTIVMFLFKTNQELLSPIDLENPEAKWVNRKEVSSLLTHIKDKEFFESVAKEI